MFKHIFFAILTLVAGAAHAGATLTDIETRWLKAAAPVLAYSQQLKLPVDIIVQPQARSSDVPLAMGFDQGRCKLVLSMRGNPNAESVLDKVPEADRAVLMEAMAAHEMGHCWRYVQGVWHALPAGFVEDGEETADDKEVLVQAKAMRENRREEGYADLVALAWTLRFHPAQYARVHAWLSALRDTVAVAHSGHDTRAWVRLAGDTSVFEHSATPFEDVRQAWQRGLLQDD
jgi:ADP-ribose pyrophosphatase YjhB (NUDIX family)